MITRRSHLGIIEEDLFKHAVNKYLGQICTKSSKKDDIYKHIDFYLEDGRSVDVKTHKTINSNDRKGVSHKYTWIELVNVAGNRGWIDGEATHIAFSLTTHYVIVSRIMLRDMVRENIEDHNTYPKGYFPKPYIKYNRVGLQDKIVLVPLKDILELPHDVLKRDNELPREQDKE